MENGKMKITKRQLKRIIKEEKTKLVKEYLGNRGNRQPMLIDRIVGMIDDEMLADKEDENWHLDPKNIATVQ